MNYKFLAGFVGVITALWLGRYAIDGESANRYGFVVWNTVLAAVPLLLEPLFWLARHRFRGVVRRAGQLLLGAVWLVFLPNTFYVLTDFMHLNAKVLVNNRDGGNHAAVYYMRGDGIYVFDSLLLLMAAIFGAYVGGLALVHAYDYFKRRTPAAIAWVIMAVIFVLSAAGVYIGRFGRWNSWDGLIQPWRVLADLLQSATSGSTRYRFFVVVLTILLFEALCFWAVRQAQQYKRV